ncbi:MAG: hypothetical protein KGK16_06770, partial [Bradyrhizobium sp.]|nr:hypothetical protein [Bradyrhizobium sp.]
MIGAMAKKIALIAKATQETAEATQEIARATPGIAGRAVSLPGIVAMKSLGRSATTVEKAAARVSKNRVTKGIATIAAVRSGHGFRGRARIARNSTVRARREMPGRSIRAASDDLPTASPIGRA